MDIITYRPVVGLTIQQAIDESIRISRANGRYVMAIINDIVMCINKNTDNLQALTEYKQKLDFKYHIEKIKRTRVK